MSTEDNKRQNNGQSDNGNTNSIFQIMDRIMNELNKTRKIFVFMFFSMMILPVTTIIIFMYTFDDPKIDRGELRANIQEFNLLSQKLKSQMIQLENLDSSGKQQDLQSSLLNSEEYKQTINRIDELSQNELKLISEEPKHNLHKKEIRLITFILSIIWIILGIRQYTILSSWGKRYNRFKKQQEEIDKKFDME
jgi:preprotein translocase subunit SecG